ncbi:hypothetical protein L249_5108 [Ophiocordyceps polyrhachis-furcata BCC 54312]|uniref:Uncharacterized protein n=1 Tax=Ophiocordyceps polyrhachis-furcata BCC 54312 TaxID=1330021 RepID=A0A367L3S6_9HYPO|nr:hypothetical protein L249_5108 [Ophiocordyceps polyrhachis-furcata BCC 54312]
MVMILILVVVMAWSSCCKAMDHPTSLDQVPDHLKIHGNKWHGVLNPAVPRALDMQLLHTSEFEDYFPTCVRFSPDDRILATGYGDCIRLYETTDFEVVCELQHDADQEEDQGDINNYDPVRCLCFFPDGKRLAVGYEKGTIRLWDIDEAVSWVTLRGHEEIVAAIAVSPDAKVMISGAHDGGLFLWDVQSQRRVRSTSVDERGVRGLVISPDGLSVTAAVGPNVQVFELPSLQLVRCLPGSHDSHVVSVAYSPRRDKLASASVDKTCKVWTMGDDESLQPRLLHTLSGHKACIS